MSEQKQEVRTAGPRGTGQLKGAGTSKMAAEPLLGQIVSRLDRSRVPTGKSPDAKGEYWAHCPYHHDEHLGNFSVSERGFKCFACGAEGGLRELAAKLDVRLHGCTVVREGITASYSLAQYAKDKQLPEGFLRSLGLCDRRNGDLTSVKLPYRDGSGQEVATRLRTARTGANRFRWTKGSKLTLYGLDRLDTSVSYVHLVEGESDAQTLWFHGEPALGVPGAATWKGEWTQHLQGLTVYVWQEPDKGGATFVRTVGKSIPEIKVIAAPPGRKDVSDCHLHGDPIAQLMADLRAAAVDYRSLQERDTAEAIACARGKAESLLREPHILDRFVELCRSQGLVGEERTVKLLYLALTSRLLPRPVSVVVKGPSSGGKSFTVDLTLRAFPPSAYHAITGMSERSLAYSTEPLEHRCLVLAEAAGLAGDFATYLLRTLLSEGCIRYETVEKTAEGLRHRLIERAGPTGLILTSTEAHLHPENETRLLSVTVRDTTQQTGAILVALADRASGGNPQAADFSAWHALQEWLQLGGRHEVRIPFAHQLAELADGRAVRLRRDFRGILNLIAGHAILQQAMRHRDPCGRIVATLDDYAVVHDLVIDLVSEGVQASVKQETREAVEAVAALDEPNGQSITYKRVGEYLGIDKSSAQRRCEVALRDGYLVNRQDKRGQPAMLSCGDPMPADIHVLPTIDQLTTLISRSATMQPCNRIDAGAGGRPDSILTRRRGARAHLRRVGAVVHG